MSETTVDYSPNISLREMITQNFMWGLAGIALGVVINVFLQLNTFDFAGKYKNELKLIIQLAVCSFVLAFLHIKVNNQFGWTWQNVTPGLFFVSYFFGTQFATFSNIQEINDKLSVSFSKQ